MSVDWEAFQGALEGVIEAGVGMIDDAEEVAAARRDFFRWVGEPFGDEPSYERRNSAFLEWLVFDRPTGTAARPPALALLHHNAATFDAAIVHGAEQLRVNVVIVATVTKVGDGELRLERWAGREKILATVGETAGVSKGAAVLGRLFSIDGQRCLSPAAEIVEPVLARSLRKALGGRSGRVEDEEWAYAAGMRLQLLRQRYPMARADELMERWQNLPEMERGG